MNPMRAVWFAIGVIALGLAALGVALPLLPTTPFLLLAAFAFARSSDRLHDWLVNHRVFGPLIQDWRQHRAIDRRVKIVSVISMAAIFALSFVLNASTTVLVVQAVVLTLAACFILSRPSPPDD